MSLTTKQEWITALRRAKKEALRLYPDDMCIFGGCAQQDIRWNEFGNARLKGFTNNNSQAWMRETNPTRAEVAAVFDRSISAIRRM